MKSERIKENGMDKYNNAEHLNLHIEMKLFMDQCGAHKINCTTEFDVYDAAISAEKENMRRQQASALTPQMDKTDSERDALILYIFALLDAGLYAPLDEIKDAYNALYPALQPYRGIGTKPHTQESAAIQAMLSEISTPQLLPHTATMGMTAAMQLLADKNQEYINLDTQRVSEVPSKKETLAVRQKTDEAYLSIIYKVEATNTLMSNEDSAMLATNINNLIDRTNATYKQRMAQ